MRILKKIMIYICVFLLSTVIGFVVNILLHKDNSMKVVWSESIGSVERNIPYADREENKFDLYIPADKSKENYGLVIYIHAGGFTSGDKSDDASILQWFTSKGYVSAGINYTLRSENNDASVFSMSNEIKLAVPYVIEKARELGYNIDKMAIAGGSAGGTLATLYAYRDAKDAPVPIQFVYAAVAPTSFDPTDWYGLGSDSKAAAHFLTPLIGTEITAEMIENGSYKEIIKPIEAYRWVNEDVPPSLVAFGKHDKIMPFATVKHLINAFEDNNVNYDYILFNHSGHGLHRDKNQQKELADRLNAYLELYMPIE